LRNEDRAWIPSGPFLSTVGEGTRWLASVNTQYNPVFGLTNFTRDILDALINLSNTELAGRQGEVMKGVFPAMKAIWSTVRGKNPSGPWAGWYREFLESGAATGYRDSYTNIEDRAKAIEKEMYDKGIRNAKGVKQVADLLSDYNTAIENATRLAAYVAARNNGMSTYAAANLAKGLTVNFNRRGVSSAAMSNLFAFFNAAAQGTARMAQTLNSPAGKKIIAGGVGLGVLQVIIGAMAMGDDDWDSIPEFVRAKNLIIPIPGINDNGYITIPMPLGFNVLPNFGRSIAEMAMYQNRWGERTGNLVAAVMDSFNPLGYTSGDTAGVLTMISPSVTDPLVAVATNKDFTGKDISREDFDPLDPTPGHARARESTSFIWKSISQAINYGTGGNEDKPGLFSPTPEAISYLFGQAFGGVGRELDKTWSFGENVVTGEKTPSYRIPMFSRFYGEAGGETALRSQYYDAIKDINIAENELKGRWERGEDIPDDIARLASMASTSRSFQHQLSNLRKYRNEAQTAEEKKRLDEGINAIQQRLVEMYRQRMED
jgi:hypothetical protein